MTKQSENEKSFDNPKLNQVLAEYLRQHDAGNSPDVEEFCKAHPEFSEAIRSYASGDEFLQNLADMQDQSEAESASLQSAETLRPGTLHNTDFEVGSQFGRYRIVRILGEGAMGSIYLAEDTNLEREVALKIPKLSGIQDEEFRQRFTREGKAAARLDHPNICRVYDADIYDGTPFLTIEFIDGPTLSRLIGTDDLQSQRRVVEIVRQIADGLQHAHENSVLHRDLKPGNVMIKNGDTACVTDFGLARRVDSGEESQLTHEGTILGTPAYMAPEQVEGKVEKIGLQADIYSLGVMFYYMLSGQLPFQGSVMSILAQVMRDEPKPLSAIRPDVDPQLEKLCLQMMSKEISNRPQSMQVVTETLTPWLNDADTRKLPPSETENSIRSTSRKTKSDSLKAHKKIIEEYIASGQYATAISGLEKMAELKSEGSQKYASWARKRLPEVKAIPKKLKQNLPSLIKTAQSLITKHDYSAAAQLLQEVPAGIRTPEADRVLHQAIDLENETQLLQEFLQERIQSRDFSGIDDNLNRFIELKPNSRFAKELRDALNTYPKFSKDLNYNFDERGRLLPQKSAVGDNWLLWGAACFLLVFGAMSYGIIIYLRNDDQTIAVEVDESWLKSQGGSINLEVDGDRHTISGPGLDVTISLGEHGFSVTSGDSVIHNPETFEIVKDGKQVLRINDKGMSLSRVNSANDPITNKTSKLSEKPAVAEFTQDSGVISSSAPAKTDDDWGKLFNGRDFTGWVNAVDGQPIRRAWKVENGEIHRSGRLVGDIRTTRKYGNFELEFEWKVSEGGNSGVIYRVEKNLAEAWKHGLEYQLFDDQNFKGDVTEKQTAGAIYGLFGTAQKTLNPGGQWNQSRIVANGTHIEHWLNGSLVASTVIGTKQWEDAVKAYDRLADNPEIGTSPTGYIVLQDHKSDVWFRDIRIRELQTLPSP